MKKLLAAAVGVFAAFGLAYGMDPFFGTGDSKFNATLERLNVAAAADPDGFIRRLSSMNGVPELDLRQAGDLYGLRGANLFMTSALARGTHRPFYAVAEEFKQSQGKGWGVMARDMGIKPGSSAFHQLKREAKGSLDYMNATANSKQKHDQHVKKSSQGNTHGKPKS
jgi:hypothetical protein